MKSYTDLEQSERLAKILPLESADMRYHTISHYDPSPCYEIVYTVEFGKAKDKDIPCWSLAVLLDILLCPSLHKTFGGWRCDSYNKEGTSYILGKPSDNPVDACVDMIIKLKELNLL